jgi:hypothetical protein
MTNRNEYLALARIRLANALRDLPISVDADAPGAERLYHRISDALAFVETALGIDPF